MIHRLKGFRTKRLRFDPITRDDVPEIYDLRTTRQNNFLGKIPTGIQSQYDYYDKYVARYEADHEVYLKITNSTTKEIYGFVRITNIQNELSLGWESLILKADCPATVGIETCFTIYYLAFDYLQRAVLGPWVVTVENIHMMKIHTYMNFVVIAAQDSRQSVLMVTQETYKQASTKFLKWGFADGFTAID
jgi:hypothetical protein